MALGEGRFVRIDGNRREVTVDVAVPDAAHTVGRPADPERARRRGRRAIGLARFVALVKRGHPFMGSMIIADVPGTQPEEYTGALKRQQMVDLEKGFAYAKKVLNVGMRWRS